MRFCALILILLWPVFPARAQRYAGTAPESLQSPPLARTETEKRILATISEAVKAGELYANVPAVDGRMLRVLAESVNAKQVLEIGTSTGISASGFCLHWSAPADD